MRSAIFFIAFLLVPFLNYSQSYAFGVKGGLTTSFQKWNNFERDPLFAYHAIAFIESAPEDNAFAVFAQAGYHVKGSAIRNRNFVNPINGDIFRPPTRKFEFRNISLTLGGKQKYDWGVNNKFYYLFGFRGDYTINTNFDEYRSINDALNTLFYPIDEFVRRWNYGATVGGGAEFPVSDYISVIIEFTVNPDFSRQYFQPPVQNVFDPYTGQSRTLRETEIRNVTFEVSVGLRFLHEIEYIDVQF
jgi:hypothetical protein